MENKTKDLMNFSFNYAKVLEKYKQEFVEIYSEYNHESIDANDCKRKLDAMLAKLYAISEIMEIFQEIIIRPDDSRVLEFYPANEIDSIIINVENYIKKLTY